MTTTQITLSESQNQVLEALSQSQGKTPEETLHEVIAQFLSRHQNGNRLGALRQARGLWRERQDLPDFALLRNEWDRV